MEKKLTPSDTMIEKYLSKKPSQQVLKDVVEQSEARLEVLQKI